LDIRRKKISETAAAPLLIELTRRCLKIHARRTEFLASMLREPVLINAEIDESGFQ